MFIQSQVKCPNCQKFNEIFIREKGRMGTFCSCGFFMNVKEGNGILNVEYYYQGKIVREKAGK